ncbi:MAG: DUF4160 domain-containing protein [Deltaproteobacteria bacterium]|nr:DUF4160 domain-containing protein [Deltaproteobacteria bacterium]
MPEVSRFFGIVVRMFFDEHPPARFHADYSEFLAVVRVQPIEVLESTLPQRALSMVLEWAARNQAGLIENWDRLRGGQSVKRLPRLP